jgi:SAM-dependent methyltransferase
MADYVEYLDRISAPKTFNRKCQWLRYNFGALFKGNQKILEIGPGLGEFISFVSETAEPIIDVIDRDQGVLDRVKSNFNVRNAWKCSAEGMAELEGQLDLYDRVFLLQVMEHIETRCLPEFLRVLYKSLVPGGLIVITVPNGGNPLGIVERYSDITHHNLFSENSLKQLVEMSDLKGATCRVKGYSIPPVSTIDIVRKVTQKLLHLILKGVMALNGGVFFSIYDPNITIVIEKPRDATS